MLDGLFQLATNALNFFYELVPNYAVAIALLTCAVMLITTPLTLKGTRSMIEMQRLQPEIRRLQAQYKDDRQKLNEEMMKFYREHQINPVGGCLPLLIQLPVFSILFYVIRGLINKAEFVGLQRALADYGLNPSVVGGFKPKYLDESSSLYQALRGETEMTSFGIDLAMSPSAALGEGFLTALPYVLILAVIGGLAWYQQKQIMGRNQGAEVNPQQQMLMRLGPILQVGFTFISPAALGVYFLISTAWRVAQQTYITHSLYKGDDSPGVQAQRALAEARAEKKTAGSNGGNGAKSNRADRAGGKPPATKEGSSGRASSGNGSSSGPNRGSSSKTAAPGGASRGASQGKAHPRSRKKKKRK